MSRRWLVTGANGYLGGELCLGLLRAGETVLGLVRPGKTPTALVEQGIACHTYEELTANLTPGDIVVHCAGKVGDRGSWDDYARTNGVWPVQLYEIAAAGGAECFIHISSVAALGYQNRAGHGLLDETAAPMVIEGEYYGRSKLQGERELAARAATSRTRLVVLRPGLIYGHRRFSSFQSRFGVDRRQRVPLVHIENLLDAVLKIGKSSGATGIFFIVDREQPVLYELNALLIERGLLQRHPRYAGRVRIRLMLFLAAVFRRLRGHVGDVPRGYARAQYRFQTRRLRYGADRLQREVGWTQQIALPEGLEDCRKATPPLKNKE